MVRLDLLRLQACVVRNLMHPRARPRGNEVEVSFSWARLARAPMLLHHMSRWWVGMGVVWAL